MFSVEMKLTGKGKAPPGGKGDPPAAAAEPAATAETEAATTGDPAAAGLEADLRLHRVVAGGAGAEGWYVHESVHMSPVTLYLANVGAQVFAVLPHDTGCMWCIAS